MLTRRHIRVKVMQSIYALYKSNNQDLNKELTKLNKSMRQMYELYLLQMSMFVELHKMAQYHIEVSKKKYLATSEDKNPNKKFVENRLLKQIIENKCLKEDIEKHQANLWDLDSEYVKIIYNNIINSALYKAYMSKKDFNFKSDKFFLINVFKEFIAPNEKLHDYIEDHEITWTDDFPWVNTQIVKLFKKANPKNKDNYYTPNLFKDLEDQKFGTYLYTKTLLNDEKFQIYINENTPNWDTERIAVLDTILIKMAICELLKFPSIPVKVTLNEYLEIAKEYSTSKSSIFINGILDKLLKDFEGKGVLKKTGRGLL